jgi:aristolochene synthase
MVSFGSLDVAAGIASVSCQAVVDKQTDILEHMSLEDGRAYNDKLMPLFQGSILPDRRVPVEWIGYDLWESMRAHDRGMADEILEPVFTFMRAQTDPMRLSEMGLGQYLEYREADVGKA